MKEKRDNEKEILDGHAGICMSINSISDTNPNNNKSSLCRTKSNKYLVDALQ